MLDRLRPPAAVTAAQKAAWPMVGALVLVVLAVSVGLIGLFHGAGWWFGLVGVSVLVLVVSGILRGAGAPRWVASLLGMVVFAAVVFAVFGGGTTIAVVVPTPSTFAHLADLYGEAWQAIDQQGVPAQPLPQLLFFVVGFGGLFAIILDIVANTLRLPAFVALAELTVLVVPALLLPQGLWLGALVLCALAYFAVLWADGRIRMLSRGGARTAVVVGAGVTAIALGAAALTPGLNQYGWQQLNGGPVTIGAGVDPLIDLAKDLRQPLPQQVLTYTTTAANPPYLQLTTLDDFDGTTWRHEASSSAPLQQDGDLASAYPGNRFGAALDPDAGTQQLPVATTSFTTKISVDTLRSVWLPAPAPVQRVTGLGGQWESEVRDGTLKSDDAQVSEQRYTVTTVRPAPTQADFDASARLPIPTSLGRDLSTGQLPPIIAQTASKVTKNADTELDEAMDLQDYFHDGQFSYSTDTPDADDPTSAEVVAAFLKRKSGYCVHFATAMTLMARSLGIPARVAMGYLPGQPSGHAPGQYAVESSDLHTWPQLYFAGIGWLDFEPTVGQGYAPDYRKQTSTTPTQTPSASPSPVLTPTNPPVTRHPVPSEQPSPQTEAPNAIAATARHWPQLLGGLLVLAILALPALIRLGRRRVRLGRLRRGAAGPELAWRELRDTAIDLGLGAPSTETPRTFASRAASGWHAQSSARDALLALREALERSAFGPPGAAKDPRHAELVEAVERELRDAASGWARLRAAVLPASVFRRVEGWRGGA